MIGQDPIDLLGHAPVERTHACFDVGDGNVQLRRRKRAGQRRVGVAVDQHPRRPLLGEDPLDRLQHATGHGGVAESADAEMMAWRSKPELLEEHVRHRGVEVLSGVDQYFVNTSAS
jgi:hypothetical protein